MRVARLAIVLAAVALLATADAAAGSVGVGHSGWFWSTPLPQGNSLDALDFDGERGYAAGEFGTLLRSDDGGTTWTALSTGITDDLARVRAIGDSSIVVAGGCTVRRSDDGGLSFRRLAWTASERGCRSSVVGLSFPSPDIGYLVLDDGRLYRSGDGGTSWSRMADLPIGSGADVLATDAWFPTTFAGVVTTADGIYRTNDAGGSWARVAERPGGFAAVTFPNPFVGYAIGDGGAVYRSSDGGASWSAVASPPGKPALAAIDCAAGRACIATTVDGDRVASTLDSGATWRLDSIGAAGARAVAFTSPTHAVAAGAAGAILLSDDRGATWSSIGSSLGGGFTRLCGSSGSLAFAIGARGALARTTDGGLTWLRLEAPSAEDLADVSFVDESTGFALDEDGSLFRTDDGGSSWRALDTGTKARPQAVLALDSERILLIGPRGLRRSRDGGQRFVRVGKRRVKRLLFGADHAGGWVFAYGPRGIFASRDGGSRWRRLRRPDHRPLAAIDFVGPHRGFALGKGGRIWRTRNRGRSWREVVATGTDGGTELAFSSRRDGYVVANDLFFARGSGRPDTVLRTTDGGHTWRPQLVADSSAINAVLATREKTDLLLAGDSEIFATSTGGDAGARSSLRLRRHRPLARPGRVHITGVLRPALAGEEVIVSKAIANWRHRRGDIDWGFKTARVRADGSFETSWPIRRTSLFVAQWTGDGRRMSAGSRALRVRVLHP
jgi:photosystem II stability/assembly factor-like uncharacterized protein